LPELSHGILVVPITTALHRLAPTRFLLGSSASALSLSYAMVALVPADTFVTQALLYGLMGSVVLAASVAYGVSLPAFFSFAVPCLLPAGLLLMTSGEPLQQGWGVLAMIVLATLSLIAWQISRLVTDSIEQRLHRQRLIQPELVAHLIVG